LKTGAAKTIRKIVIAVIVLAVLFVIAGVAYVLIADQSAPKPAAKPAHASTDTQPSALPKPVQPGPNAQEGVAIEAVTTPVAAGANSSVAISTNAGSTCTITVTYSGVPSTDSGLAPKTADPYGNVTWAWTVGSTVPVGTWPIKVTCVYHGRTGVVLDDLQVTK